MPEGVCVVSDFIDFWSLYTKGREYGFKSSDYAGGKHRGQDVPGAVKGHEWIGKAIPLLRPGRLIEATTATKIGGVFIFDVEDGEFDIYCHTRPMGDSFRLSSRDDLAKWRGTSWRGPHLHLVRSRFADAGWNDNRSTLDPRPIIRARLKAARDAEKPASTPKPPTPKPLPVPITLEGIDMLTIVYIKAKGDVKVFALDTLRGTRRHVTAAEWAAIKTAHTAAGVKLPFSEDKLSATQLEQIPIG